MVDTSAQCSDGDARCSDRRARQCKHLGEMQLSILEKVLLLDLNAILNQQSPILIGKYYTMMVLFLLGDITHYSTFIKQTA